MKLQLNNNGLNNWVTVEPEGESFKLLLDYPTPEQEQYLQSISWGNEFTGDDKKLKYAQHLIKYTVKDWQGINDENSNPVKLVIKNHEMDEKQWWALVRDLDLCLKIFSAIIEKIDFDFISKKKSHGQPTSNEKESLKESEATTQ